MVVFLTAMGSGVSYALWSTSASTSAQVKAATVAMTVDGTAATSALSVPHKPNESYTSAVTVTNSGTAAFTYKVAVAPTGGTLAHSSVTIALWKSASSCTSASTVPADAWTGTLAALAAHGSEPMAVSGSQLLCVRTTLAVDITSAQQGQTASANLVFTAANGWTSSKSVAISPSAYTVPNPVLLGGQAGCKDTTSQKSVALGWQPVSGASEYRVYFTPAALPPKPAYMLVTIAEAASPVSVSGESFDTVTGSSQGSGSVSIRAVVNGWESSGLVVPIYFAPNSTGSNTKISCARF